jgi:antitoxin PrlF
VTVAKLSSKSQIVVPEIVRARLGLKPGDRVTIDLEDDRAILRKSHVSALDELLKLARPEVYKDGAIALDDARDEWDDPA